MDSWLAELRWAAGLFEGEGSVATQRCLVAVGMTDKDSVDRFHAAVGFGHSGVQEKRPPYKRLYLWRAESYEHTQALAALLWWGLGIRRRAQFAQILNKAKLAPVRASLRTVCPNGHKYDRTLQRRTGPKAGAINRYCSLCANQHRKKYGRYDGLVSDD